MANRSRYERLLEGGGVAPFPGWALIRVSGADAERFLQSQVTSNLRGLRSGTAQLSALLDISGRLRAFFFIACRHRDFLLLIPEGLRAPTVEALQRYVVADDVGMDFLEAGPMRVWLGPLGLAAARDIPTEQRLLLTIYGLRGAVTWGRGSSGLDPVDEETLEALRILSGLPRWGVEADEGGLINETPLVATALSFEKGCFLGQETVVKVRSGRGPSYAAMLLRTGDKDSERRTRVGGEFRVEDRRAGRVLSCAEWDGSSWLWVQLFRDFRVPGRELECRFANGGVVRGRVESFPRVGPPALADDVARLQRLAAECYAAGDERGAIGLLETAIDLDPGFSDAYESLGVILGRAGRSDEAVELMKSFLKAQPESVLGHANLSRLYAEKGMIEEAETERALAAATAMSGRRKPEKSVAASADAAAGDRAGEGREAIYRQVLEVHPDDALANLELGKLLLERGRLREAADRLDLAVAADPKMSAAYLALGRARLELGEELEAARILGEGIGVATRNGDTSTAASLQQHLASLRPAG